MGFEPSNSSFLLETFQKNMFICKDTKKKLSEMTNLLDELKSLLTTEQQKEKIEQIDSCQLSLIALSERDAYLEGFKLGVRMATEIYTDTQQRG